jgi:hypothetical protein
MKKSRVALVDHRDDPYLRKGFVGLFDLGEHPPGDLDSVGIGLLPDGHANAAFPVYADDARKLFIGVRDAGDLAERNRRPFPFHDDRVPDLIEIRELGRRAEGYFVAPLFDLARGQVEVGVADRLEHPVEGQSQGIDPVGVQFDPDLPVEAPPKVDLGNTRDVGEAVANLVLDQLREFHGIEIAGDAEQDNRKAGDVELGDPGPHDVLGKLVDLVFQLGLDIQRGRVDVRAPHEADADAAVALGRLGHHVLNAWHGADDLFDDLGDQALHDLRACPLVPRADGKRRQLDVGKEIDPYAA